MPPKTTFIKRDVVHAALEIVKDRGFSELSMRKVAERMGCSPAPVYSSFRSKGALEKALLAEVKQLLYEYASKNYTRRKHFNLAIGLVLFAGDYSRLFRSLFLQRTDFEEIFKEFHKSYIEGMQSDERFAGMAAEARDGLLSRLWIFTYGLATLVSAGLLEDKSEAGIIKTLSEVGTLMIEDAL
ncbi:TetR/AcrR family transcriptional regulator [Thermodesulfobacteriota bacterium]